jgi:hypothetical protein
MDDGPPPKKKKELSEQQKQERVERRKQSRQPKLSAKKVEEELRTKIGGLVRENDDLKNRLRDSGIATASSSSRENPALKPKVFVVGLPKAGTTSIDNFLRSCGWETCHWKFGRKLVSEVVLSQLEKEADIFEALPGVNALTQMDGLEWDRRRRNVKGGYPQMTHLASIVDRYPDAKFILNKREQHKFKASFEGWRNGDLLARTCRHLNQDVATFDCIDMYNSHCERVLSVFTAKGKRASLLELDIEGELAAVGLELVEFLQLPPEYARYWTRANTSKFCGSPSCLQPPLGVGGRAACSQNNIAEVARGMPNSSTLEGDVKNPKKIALLEHFSNSFHVLRSSLCNLSGWEGADECQSESFQVRCLHDEGAPHVFVLSSNNPNCQDQLHRARDDISRMGAQPVILRGFDKESKGVQNALGNLLVAGGGAHIAWFALGFPMILDIIQRSDRDFTSQDFFILAEDSVHIYKRTTIEVLRQRCRALKKEQGGIHMGYRCKTTNSKHVRLVNSEGEHLDHTVKMRTLIGSKLICVNYPTLLAVWRCLCSTDYARTFYDEHWKSFYASGFLAIAEPALAGSRRHYSLVDGSRFKARWQEEQLPDLQPDDIER